jgi:hypothetical protein
MLAAVFNGCPTPSTVMAGLVPAIHDFSARPKSWMPSRSLFPDLIRGPGMTG